MEAAGDKAAQRFAKDLVRLRRAAGMPSYSTLERLSEHRLSRSTMSDVLTGKRVRLPEWRFVAAFVAACRAAADESDLEPAELGTPADWKRRWDAAAAGFTDVPYPGSGDAGRPPGNATPPDDAAASLVQTHDAPAARRSRSTAVSLWGPIPQRTHDFVGREAALGALHRCLAGRDGTGRIVVQGLGGIGKTQLAIAYANRFRDEYDLVGWVPSDSREAALAGMALLEIAETPETSADARAASVVETLRRGRPYARWLLVFDNADEPDEIKDLMPPGPGDIIVTTRNGRWSAFEDLYELDVLPRAASVELLLRRMRGLSEADAHRLAEASGDLPLVLEHAAESRIPVDEYLAELASAPRRLLSANQPLCYPVPVSESWDATIEYLRAEVPAALDLLRCCAFFGTGPIPLESLERGRYLPQSSLHTILLDPILRSRAIGALGRTALARVNSARRTIHVHRLVQGVVRDGLSASDAERSRHDVHLLLAAADPGDPDDFDNWPRYEELRGHMTPSDTEGCRDLTVQRLVLNVVRYLRVVGDPVHARALADRALGRWAATAADGTDALAMNLAINRSKADALRALGEHAEAFELSRDTLERMRAALGGDHEETVILGRSIGAESRMRGLFAEALVADQASVEAHLRVFDRDHPQTFMAVSNLAVSYALNGWYEDAVREDEKVYRDCLTFYGRSDHPAVLSYQNAMARSMRQAGRYREALASARAAGDGYRSMIERGVLRNDHPWVLTNANELAAARRDAGDPKAHELASDVHNRCWRIFGVDHPQTLAAAVTLGTALRAAGRPNEAADTLTDAARRYASTLGDDHPYTHACTASVAAVRRQGGDPVTARAMLDTALAGLRRTVGGEHPYTLTAMISRANTLADLGDAESAAASGREALGGLRRVLGRDHPHTLAGAGSVSLALTALGRDEDAAAMRADTLVRYQQSLGEEHRDVALFLQRRPVEVDFSPMPI